MNVMAVGTARRRVGNNRIDVTLRIGMTRDTCRRLLLVRKSVTADASRRERRIARMRMRDFLFVTLPARATARILETVTFVVVARDAGHSLLVDVLLVPWTISRHLPRRRDEIFRYVWRPMELFVNEECSDCRQQKRDQHRDRREYLPPHSPAA